MSQKTALKTVGILVLISVLALGINFILIKAFPEKFDPQEKAKTEEHEDQKTEADELPINEMKLTDTTKNNRDVWSWPYDSAVPVYHYANLEIYQGKTKEETTLEGIKVYLALDPVESSVSTETIEQEADSSIDQENDEQADPLENSEDDEGEMVFETIPNLLINDQDLQDILENIVQYTKESLESIGAEVILVDQKYLTDTQKAAFVGTDILQDFSAELAEQDFKSERLSSLLDPLQTIQNSPNDSQVVDQFFPNVGVSVDQRLLLDVERQYTDRIFINLQYGSTESEDIAGSRVIFLGNETAAIGAQGEAMTEDSPEKPAYVGYLTDSRSRYANLSEKNISQLIPGLAYSSEGAVAEQIVPALRLINLTSVEIEIGQKERTFDLQILNSNEQQKIFAEAISNACYEYYCTDLK